MSSGHRYTGSDGSVGLRGRVGATSAQFTSISKIPAPSAWYTGNSDFPTRVTGPQIAF